MAKGLGLFERTPTKEWMERSGVKNAEELSKVGPSPLGELYKEKLAEKEAPPPPKVEVEGKNIKKFNR